MRYKLLIEAENDKLFIIDKYTNYIEVISNIDYENWLKTMKYKMDSMYINQV
jgi:hypothetical protein